MSAQPVTKPEKGVAFDRSSGLPDGERTESAKSPLWVLSIAAFAGTIAISSFVAVIGPVVRQLGLAEWHSGLAVTIAGVFWTLLAKRWGRLSDRIGRRTVLLLGLGVSTILYLCLAIFVDFSLRFPPGVLVAVTGIVALRSAIGAFHSSLPPTAAALVADASAPEKRAASMAKLGTATSLGMIVGPALASSLASYHLSYPMYAAAALPAFAWIALYCALPVQPSRSGLDNNRPAPRALPQKYSFFSDTRLLFPALVAFTAMTAVSVAQISIGFFAIDRWELTPERGATVAGLVLTCVGIGLILGQTTVIRWKSISPATLVAIGTGISGLGFASVPWVTSWEQLLVAYGFAAIGMGITNPSVQAIAANAVGKNEQGSAAGTLASTQGMGMLLGPLLGTLIYQISSSAPYHLIGLILQAISGSTPFLRKLTQPA